MYKKIIMEYPAIGIDLGTIYCSVGTLRTHRIEIIAFNDGSRSLPSHIYFNPDKEEIMIGSAAKYTAKTIKQSIYDSKRFIGSNYNDEYIQDNIKKWPFKVVDCDGIPKV